MVDTKVTLSGWELDNPVIPASGTFGFGKELCVEKTSCPIEWKQYQLGFDFLILSGIYN